MPSVAIAASGTHGDSSAIGTFAHAPVTEKRSGLRPMLNRSILVRQQINKTLLTITHIMFQVIPRV